ncbi:MAG: leucine-rich repeat protein [Treponema sp.]|nr:leucine-rich repeat protein [Treponema sp.]
MKKITITSIFAATVITLFSACNNSSSSTWEEPVNDYFDKYTNTAAIEKQEINFPTQKDNSGTTCITSDGDKTVTFYLRNPRQYTLNTSFSDPDSHPHIRIEQDMQDKTIIRVTYSQSYLQEHEGGQQIGGTIYLSEAETLREFDPYSFSLKCNSPPPSVNGQSVQTDGNNYIVCFYLPTSQLDSPTHTNDSHTVYINGEAVASRDSDGNLTMLTPSASTTRPSTLDVIPESGAAPFTGTSADGTAIYYDTGIQASIGKFIRWTIYLEDDDGFKSNDVNADSIVTPANLSVSGNEVLTLSPENGETSSTLTASVDSGVIASCTWTPASPSVITINQDPQNSSNATVTASATGTETITVTATLEDGRTLEITKTIHVVGLAISGNSNFLAGSNEKVLTATPTDTASNVVWSSANPAVATAINPSISAGGYSINVNALSTGKTTITVSADMYGKTITAKKEIFVHNLTITGETETMVGTENTVSLSASLASPEGFGGTPSYSWTSGSPSVATVPNPATGPNVIVTPSNSNSGTSDITATVTIDGENVGSSKKTVTVYGIEISGKQLLDELGTGGSYTAYATIGSNSYTPPSAMELVWGSTPATGIVSITGSTKQTKTISPIAAGGTELTVTATINSKSYTAKKKLYVIGTSGRTTFIAGETARSLVITPAANSSNGITYDNWNSSSTSVAGIAANGKISAKSAGSSNITFRAKIGSETLTLTARPISVNEVTLKDLSNSPLPETVEPITMATSYCKVTLPDISGCTLSVTGAISSNTENVTVTWDSAHNWIKATPQKPGQSADISVKISIDGEEVTVKLYTVKAKDCISPSGLNDYLATLDPTEYTVDNPLRLQLPSYEEYTGEKSRAVATALKNHPNIYVDLSDVTLDDTKEDWSHIQDLFRDCTNLVYPPVLIGWTDDDLQNCFRGCSNLKTAPTLPSGITSLLGTFDGCSSLTSAPTIPSSVTNMWSTFSGCTGLTTAPDIPYGVEEMNYCFEDCTNLVTGPTIPATTRTLWNCFSGCTKLKTVTIKYDGSEANSLARNSSTYSNTFTDCPAITQITYNTTTAGAATAETSLITDYNPSVVGKITVTH